MYNCCIPIRKRGRAPKVKFSARKVSVEEMVCKFGCHERGKSFANEHWAEAELKSDWAGCLMNVAEFKANFMDKSYYY